MPPFCAQVSLQRRVGLPASSGIRRSSSRCAPCWRRPSTRRRPAAPARTSVGAQAGVFLLEACRTARSSDRRSDSAAGTSSSPKRGSSRSRSPAKTLRIDEVAEIVTDQRDDAVLLRDERAAVRLGAGVPLRPFLAQQQVLRIGCQVDAERDQVLMVAVFGRARHRWRRRAASCSRGSSGRTRCGRACVPPR